MASPVNKAKQFRNISEHNFGKIVEPTPLLEETKPDRDTASDFAVDGDQLTTQAGLRAVPFMPSSWSLPATDGISIENQATWQLPAIPKSGIISKQASPSTTQTPGDESYLVLVRNLGKSSGIYAISTLASPLVSMILAPFLTHSLSITDYGALTVLSTAISLATSITQLGLSTAIARAYIYDFEERRDRLGVLSTSVVLLSFISIFVALAVVMSAPWVASILLGSSSFGDSVRITALVVLVQNLSVPGFAWLRAESRAKVFSALSIINLLIALGANVIFVGVAHMGITGSLLATGAGYAVVVICILPLILLRAGFAFRWDITWNLLSFGIPLVFNAVSFWVLQLSDRYLLSRLGSLAQTASYGAAYNLGGALYVVIIAPFTLAWPITMYTIAKKEDAPQIFRLVFRWFSMVLLLAAFVLGLIAIAAFDILFPPSYHSAAPIIPIIALSATFFGIYNIFAVGIGVLRKTWFAPLVMTLAALVNVASNIVLIPLYGAMGAALSTLIAFVLLALIMYIVNQRIYPVPFEIDRFAIALLIGIAVYVGSSFLAQHQTIYGTCAIYIGSTILYGGCLLLLGRFPGKNQKRTQQYV